ncbi:MAG: ATP-binding protein [Propionicimonas sp.]
MPAAWLAYADALLHREAMLWRVGGGVPPREAAGWFVTDADVEAILAGLPGLDGADPARAAELEQRLAGDLEARRTEFVASLDGGRFGGLAGRAGLDEPGATVLALLAAVERSPQRQRLIAYLHDDMRLPRLSLGLLERLVGAEPVAPDAALIRLGLAGVEAEGPWSNRMVSLASRVSWHLLGQDAPDEHLPPVRRIPASSLRPDDPPARSGMVPASLPAIPAEGSPTLTLVHGADAESRLRAASGLLPGRPQLVVRAPLEQPALTVLVREAVVTAAALVIETEDPGTPLLARAVEIAPEVPWVISSPRELPLSCLPDVPWRELSVEAGLADEAAWRGLFGETPAGQRLDREQFRLVTQAMAGGSTSVGQAIRRLAAGELDRLALRTRPRYGWEDLVLPADQTRQLAELADRYRARSLVYGDWGFSAAPSAGIVALFAGPPGTGKTMAAEVIAGDLGLDLYKVDLSGVVSKYIGETEKNLDRIFEAARAAEVVLFFDEADALFGKRSEVSDAHDRYANIEVAYLLQRLERHDGLVVLATNLQRNIDQAFTRRIAVWVDFRPPEEADRRRIWELNFPARAPVGEIDLEFLARNFAISGGTIRNAALAAAFLAAADARPITMDDVVIGLKREFQKSGKLRTPAEFDKYYYLVAEDDAAPAR